MGKFTTVVLQSVSIFGVCLADVDVVTRAQKNEGIDHTPVGQQYCSPMPVQMVFFGQHAGLLIMPLH